MAGLLLLETMSTLELTVPPLMVTEAVEIGADGGAGSQCHFR